MRLVGRPPALNWVQYHAETGSYDVTVRLDPRTANNPKGRELFRLQLQGPFAGEIFEKVNGGPMPEIPFFHMGKFNIGKHAGDRAQPPHVRASLAWSSSGRTRSSRACGTRCSRPARNTACARWAPAAYASVATESGWVANTVPAIYTGAKMKAFASGYRSAASRRTWRWRAATCPSGPRTCTSPVGLGYGKSVKFDHEFIGREALENLAPQPHRQKVWLCWQARRRRQDLRQHVRAGRQAVQVHRDARRVLRGRARRPGRVGTAGSSGCRRSPSTRRTSGAGSRWP